MNLNDKKLRGNALKVKIVLMVQMFIRSYKTADSALIYNNEFSMESLYPKLRQR